MFTVSVTRIPRVTLDYVNYHTRSNTRDASVINLARLLLEIRPGSNLFLTLGHFVDLNSLPHVYAIFEYLLFAQNVWLVMISDNFVRQVGTLRPPPPFNFIRSICLGQLTLLFSSGCLATEEITFDVF